MTKEELENYEPKGDLTGFPKEVIARMLDCQQEQGTKRDVTIFEKYKSCSLGAGGFDWHKTKEEDVFWCKVILGKNFDLFFEKYPKQDNQDNSQEFNLENYVPKGQLIGFPKEIIARMLECQEEQGTPRDISVFERDRTAGQYVEGFAWYKTKEGNYLWHKIINNKNFNLFFEKYPKQDNQYNSQEFKVGDNVIDIIRGRIGKVTDIDIINKDSYPISAEFNDNEVISFTLDGRDYTSDKYPRLLHYRDDYDYSVINFNNLPKRQEPKRWRAKKGEIFYSIYIEDMGFCRCANLDKYNNEYYEYGNYFKTEEEAQEVADKLNEYFKQLINK